MEEAEATAKTDVAACRRRRPRRRPMPPKEGLAPTLLLFRLWHWAWGTEEDDAEAPERARAFIANAKERKREEGGKEGEKKVERESRGKNLCSLLSPRLSKT